MHQKEKKYDVPGTSQLYLRVSWTSAFRQFLPMMFQPPRTVFSKHDFQEKYQIKSVLYDGVFDFSGNYKPLIQ